MAIENEAQLKARFEAGQTMEQVDFHNLIETLFSLSPFSDQNQTVSASDLIGTFQRIGTDVNFSKTGSPRYTIEIPTGCNIRSCTLTGGTINTDGSSQLTVVVRDTSGSGLLYRPAVIGIVSSGIAQNLTVRLPQYSISAAGEITMVLPNLNFGVNGWKVILLFSSSTT